MRWLVGSRLLLVVTSLWFAACAARRFSPPADIGTSLPGFSDIFVRVTRACVGVRTFTTEIGLSGRVGAERIRGRLVAGFKEPDAMRLEGLAPFGPPVFVMVAQGGRATLLLPRDNAVVSDAAPEDVLNAMAGVALPPADLQAVLTGCVTVAARPRVGRLHAGGWASLDTDAATLYLRREGNEWRLHAARRDGWLIEYSTWRGEFPATIRLRSEGAASAVDLQATMAQHEVNVDIDGTAFQLTIPIGAEVRDLAGLRRRGPLGGTP